MIVSVIFASDCKGLIGKENGLPWHLPADLKHFRKLTTGHSILMGRKTYESIGKPLPKRRNLVISRNPDYVAEGCEVFASLGAAVEACGGEEEIFIIGGVTIYRQAFESGIVNRIYHTQIHEEFDGDAYFSIPEIDSWEKVAQTDHLPDEKNKSAYSFITYIKRI